MTTPFELSLNLWADCLPFSSLMFSPCVEAKFIITLQNDTQRERIEGRRKKI